jgi:hypothetical protein
MDVARAVTDDVGIGSMPGANGFQLLDGLTRASMERTRILPKHSLIHLRLMEQPWAFIPAPVKEVINRVQNPPKLQVLLHLLIAVCFDKLLDLEAASFLLIDLLLLDGYIDIELELLILVRLLVLISCTLDLVQISLELVFSVGQVGICVL